MTTISRKSLLLPVIILLTLIPAGLRFIGARASHRLAADSDPSIAAFPSRRAQADPAA